MKGRRVGFVSTRLAGSDGVSLETRKWTEVLERMGHECCFMAGELDTPPERSIHVPECHFTHPEILQIYEGCFGRDVRSPSTTDHIQDLKRHIKKRLAEFVSKFGIQVLVPENAITIPMNLPLGLAITEFAIETGMPIIAHHHDFYWERQRFLYNACWDYLHMAFPPHLYGMQHAVLNSSQDHQLSLRTGISARIVPNVMDFGHPPPPDDGYGSDFRERLGILPEEKLILQPTRVVQRKGIERAIELVRRLEIPAVLVVSHASGDEGDEYSVRVREYSEMMNVRTVFCSGIVDDERGRKEDGSKVYGLADVYRQADLVTYPSRVEGFGNAFLEAIYYKCPLMVNNYATYSYDIRPKGFQTVEMNDYITADVVEQARKVLQRPAVLREITDHNYGLARRFFSYEVLGRELEAMLLTCFGW
jgi:glycosyltransferase involved in cell wall biosynthesis